VKRFDWHLIIWKALY